MARDICGDKGAIAWALQLAEIVDQDDGIMRGLVARILWCRLVIFWTK